MSQGHGPLESDTCRDYVLPALQKAGWRSDQIVEQRYFTDGRIIARARGHRRDTGKRSDYLLEIHPDLPLAVVEAKREYKLPSDGLQQAMDYAEILGLGFAYASNGRGIVEHDYDHGRQTDLTEFPSHRARADRRFGDEVREAPPPPYGPARHEQTQGLGGRDRGGWPGARWVVRLTRVPDLRHTPRRCEDIVRRPSDSMAGALGRSA